MRRILDSIYWKLFFRNPASLILCVSLLFSDIPVQAQPLSAGSASSSLLIPSSLGYVEESRKAGEKTIFYIQDAHDSLEAQENIASMVSFFVNEADVQTVLEEGYEGPLPGDDYFSAIPDSEVREKVSYYLMDQLRIGGAEYAYINRTRPFVLIGSDDSKLHFENVEWYRKTALGKDAALADLQTLQNEIIRIANRDFPGPLKNWMKLKKRLDSGQISFADYLLRFISIKPDFFDRGHLTQSVSAAFPALDLLYRALKSPGPENSQVENFNARILFREVSDFENMLADSLLEKKDTLRVFEYYKALELLKRLNALEISSEEYAALQESLRDYTTDDFARMIVKQSGKPAAVSRRWEENVRNAMFFYETAARRDQAVEDKLLEFKRNEKESTAVLVFGGFHRDAIRSILRKHGFSYQIITPQISEIQETHRMRYRELMGAAPAQRFFSGAAPEAARVLSDFALARFSPEYRILFQNDLHKLEAAARRVTSESSAGVLLEMNQILAAQENSLTVRAELRAPDSGKEEFRPRSEVEKVFLQIKEIRTEAAKLEGRERTEKLKELLRFFRETNLQIRKGLLNSMRDIQGDMLQVFREYFREIPETEDEKRVFDTVLVTAGFLYREEPLPIREELVELLRPMSIISPEMERSLYKALRYLNTAEVRSFFLKKLTDKTLDEKSQFAILSQIGFTRDTAYILPLFDKAAARYEDKIAPERDFPYVLSYLLTPEWIADNIENPNTLTAAYRFGFLDEPTYQLLRSAPSGETKAAIVEILRSAGIVTETLLQDYEAEEESSRSDTLRYWRRKIMENTVSFEMERLYEKQKILPLPLETDPESRLERDLYFAALREHDIENVIEKLAVNPFDRKENERITGRYFFISVKRFEELYKTAAKEGREVFETEALDEEIQEILLPYYVSSYLVVQSQPQNEARANEESIFRSRWRTLARILTLKKAGEDKTYLTFKPRIWGILDALYPNVFPQRTDLSESGQIEDLISKLSDRRYGAVLLYGVLDAESVWKTHLFMGQAAQIEGWEELSYGARAALKLYAYDLFSSQSDLNLPQARELFQPLLEELLEEERVLKKQVPSVGIELQTTDTLRDQVYSWKEALEFLDIPSPYRPEYNRIVEAAFPPAWSTKAFTTAIPILIKLGYHHTTERQSAFHISLSGNIGTDARFLAFPLLSFRSETDKIENDHDWFTRQTRVMSKGLIHLNRQSREVDPGSSNPGVHTEIRTARLQYADPEKGLLNQTYEIYLPGVQALAAAREASLMTSENRSSREILLGEIWNTYRRQLESLYREEKYQTAELLNADWFESTGDPEDMPYLKRLPIMQTRLKIRHYYRDREENLAEELHAQVRDIFTRHAQKALEVLTARHDARAELREPSSEEYARIAAEAERIRDLIDEHSLLQNKPDGTGKSDIVKALADARDLSLAHGDIETIARLVQQANRFYPGRNKYNYLEFDDQNIKQQFGLFSREVQRILRSSRSELRADEEPPASKRESKKNERRRLLMAEKKLQAARQIFRKRLAFTVFTAAAIATGASVYFSLPKIKENPAAEVPSEAVLERQRLASIRGIPVLDMTSSAVSQNPELIDAIAEGFDAADRIRKSQIEQFVVEPQPEDQEGEVLAVFRVQEYPQSAVSPPFEEVPLTVTEKDKLNPVQLAQVRNTISGDRVSTVTEFREWLAWAPLAAIGLAAVLFFAVVKGMRRNDTSSIFDAKSAAERSKRDIERMRSAAEEKRRENEGGRSELRSASDENPVLKAEKKGPVTAVVIADDERMNRALLQSKFRDYPVAILETAANADEAYTAVMRLRADGHNVLLVTDGWMPDKDDGARLVERLRGAQAEIPVLYHSSSEKPELPGNTAFISKTDSNAHSLIKRLLDALFTPGEEAQKKSPEIPAKPLTIFLGSYPVNFAARIQHRTSSIWRVSGSQSLPVPMPWGDSIEIELIDPEGVIRRLKETGWQGKVLVAFDQMHPFEGINVVQALQAEGYDAEPLAYPGYLLNAPVWPESVEQNMSFLIDRYFPPSGNEAKKLETEKIYSQDPDFLKAVELFNQRILERDSDGRLRRLDWRSLIALYEEIRGDHQNPDYGEEDRLLRFSHEDASWVREWLYLINRLEAGPAEVLEAAIRIYRLSSEGENSSQMFVGKAGFDRVREPKKEGAHFENHPADGHHRLAWFLMNFFLIRNGYPPFYFSNEKEYLKIPIDYYNRERGEAKLRELLSERVFKGRAELRSLPPEKLSSADRKRTFMDLLRNIQNDILPQYAEGRGVPADTAAGKFLPSDPVIVAEILQEVLQGGEHVIDLGSGSGTVLHLALGLGAGYATGFETDTELLEKSSRIYRALLEAEAFGKNFEENRLRLLAEDFTGTNLKAVNSRLGLPPVRNIYYYFDAGSSAETEDLESFAAKIRDLPEDSILIVHYRNYLSDDDLKGLELIKKIPHEHRTASYIYRVPARAELRSPEETDRFPALEVEKLQMPAAIFLDARELLQIREEEADTRFDEILVLLEQHPGFDLYIDHGDRYPLHNLEHSKLKQVLSSFPGRVHFGEHSRANLAKKKILLQVSFFSENTDAQPAQEIIDDLRRRYNLQSEVLPVEYLLPGTLKGFLDLAESLTAAELLREIGEAYATRSPLGRWRIAADFAASLWTKIQNHYAIQWSA